jgi:transposase
MTKAKENKAEQVVVVEVTNTEVKLGRPVNESSRRQQILKLREAKKQNGEFKLGRPVKEGSARQLRLQELANKAANGKKGALIALVKGTVSDTVIDILHKIPEFQRKKVKEITLDLAPTMERIAKRSFPKAKLVSDRFHVQKLASDAVQEIRIKHRWAAIEQENQEIEYAKELKKKYVPEILENGDTLKQLLVRSRFLLYKRESKWSASQVYRAEILFRLYPDLKEAYKQSMELSNIFSHSQNRLVAFKKLALWYNSIEKLELKSFNTIAKTIQNNYEHILNYFDNKSTNASAESFNAKIKALRSQFRGVRDITFFLFRLQKIYA